MIKELFRKKSVARILQEVSDAEGKNSGGLKKSLRLRDLISFGIAAIIGAGIFSTIGKASADGGPAVVYLFMFTAVACSFTAFAYAEFASMVPVSGSAYTYSYVAFGEIIAWIIGWALIMEYAVSNIVVAISWSDYFTSLLDGLNLRMPRWMTMDYLSSADGYHDATLIMHSGKTLAALTPAMQDQYEAWRTAPLFFGFHVVADIPALVIVILITWLVYLGIRESRNASNIMVAVKLLVLLMIIGVGVFYIKTGNWIPFAPKGASGVLRGVSAVFFAYIGFDALSTTAEECHDPQRDLPRGMMWSIVISTLLYVTIALVLTGIVHYDLLGVGDPLAFVFERLHMHWLSGVIAVSAVVAMSSALLVYQLGQPRIWMSMSRDGLLPKAFSRIHPVYKTPGFATIVTGFVVAVPALFMNLTTVTDLTSIGTLFAFTLVCAGVLKLQNDPSAPRGKFKTPYINSKYVMLTGCAVFLLYAFTLGREKTMTFLVNKPQLLEPSELITSLEPGQIARLKSYCIAGDAKAFSLKGADLKDYLSSLSVPRYDNLIRHSGLKDTQLYDSGMHLFLQKIPLWIFIVFFGGALILSLRHNLSLIPLLGFLCCMYMMAQLALINWIGFSIWLLLGLSIYFSFGRRHSKLRLESLVPESVVTTKFN